MDKKLSQDLLTVCPTQLLEFTEISHTYLPASIGEVVASIIFLKGKNNFVTFLCQEWAMLLNCTHRRFDNLGSSCFKGSLLDFVFISGLRIQFFFLKKKMFLQMIEISQPYLSAGRRFQRFPGSISLFLLDWLSSQIPLPDKSANEHILTRN